MRLSDPLPIYVQHLAETQTYGLNWRTWTSPNITFGDVTTDREVTSPKFKVTVAEGMITLPWRLSSVVTKVVTKATTPDPWQVAFLNRKSKFLQYSDNRRFSSLSLYFPSDWSQNQYGGSHLWRLHEGRGKKATTESYEKKVTGGRRLCHVRDGQTKLEW